MTATVTLSLLQSEYEEVQGPGIVPHMSTTATRASDVIFDNIICNLCIIDERPRGTKTELAEILRVTLSRVTQWFRDRPNIQANTLQAIAQALQVPMASLLNGNLEKPLRLDS